MALRARETFWGPNNRLVREGQVVSDKDWIVEGREELFDEVPGGTASPDAVAELNERIKALEAAGAGAGSVKAAAKTAKGGGQS